MAISTNEVKERVELICAKDQKTIYLNADKFNKYAPLAQDMIITNQRKKFEAGLISSDALSPLKKKTSFNVDPNTGQLTKPSDYMYYITMSKTVFNLNKRGQSEPSVNAIDFVSDNELGERLGNKFKSPTTRFPIVAEYENFLQVYPKTTGVVDLIYLREPLIPFWNRTIVNNEEVYAATGGSLTNPNAGVTAGNSTDFDLPYQFKDELIWQIAELLGVTVRQSDLVQAGQALKTQE